MTPDPAIRARDEGMARVQENSPAAYRAAAFEAVELLIAARKPFTVDDIRALIPKGLDQPHLNFIPALIGARAKSGVIVPAGRYRTTRTARHSSKNTVWTAHTPATEEAS